MANEYAVNQADLTAVADAIREKGGTSDALEFPGGFVDAVEAIQGSGYTIDDIANPYNVSGDIVITATEINGYAFSGAQITSVVAENATICGGNAFYNCKKLKRARLPKCVSFYNRNYAFAECTVLVDVDLESMSEVGEGMFSNCTSLESIVLPSAKNHYNNAFSNCTALKLVDYHERANFFRQYAFQNCSSLEAIVLRNAEMSWLGNLNSFNNTPLSGYGGTYSGHIYVPSSLISSYQTGTNWSTMYANYPEIFQPIEGSEYE